jgi:hypothetical protein
VVGGFVGEGKGEEMREGSVGVDLDCVEDVVSEGRILFEEDANHQVLRDFCAVEAVDKMYFHGVMLAVDGMLGRMVEVELPRFENIVVGLVRVSDPGIVGEEGLDVFVGRGSELDHWVLPINLVAFGCRTDV